MRRGERVDVLTSAPSLPWGACKQRHVNADLGDTPTPLHTGTAQRRATGGAARRWLDWVIRLHS